MAFHSFNRQRSIDAKNVWVGGICSVLGWDIGRSVHSAINDWTCGSFAHSHHSGAGLSLKSSSNFSTVRRADLDAAASRSTAPQLQHEVENVWVGWICSVLGWHMTRSPDAANNGRTCGSFANSRQSGPAHSIKSPCNSGTVRPEKLSDVTFLS